MKIDKVIELLGTISKPYWFGQKTDTNSYNEGFNEGVSRAIRLLKIVEDKYEN